MKILIAGYYGFGNLGDELILSVLIKTLKNQYPQSTLTVLSSNVDKSKQEHKILASNRWNIFTVISELYKTDLFVLGGGGLIQDRTSGRSLVYYLGLIFWARFFGKKTILYALGVDPISRPWLRWIFKKLVQSPPLFISVRDRESQYAMSELGISESVVRLIADPVFSFEVPAVDLSPQVLFIPRYPVEKRGTSLYDAIKNYFASHNKLPLRIILFQPQLEAAIMPKSFLKDTIFRANYLEQVKVIGESSVVISARFHGLVLAARYGIPFMGLGAERKVFNLCKKLGMPHLPWDATNNDVKRELGKLLALNRLRQMGANPSTELQYIFP